MSSIDPDITALDAHMTQVFAAIKAGKAVLVADADTREGEVDVVFAAGHATESLMAWTVRHTSGYICVPMPADRADALGLPLMVAHNEDPRRTAYTVSVDAAAGITTGISAGDRAASCRVLADPATQPGDLIRPGHVLPLRAHAGGVFARPGHTEAAVDIVRLSGAGQVAVICEVVRDDGRMMRAHDARQFATAQGLEFCTIEELITWRRLHDPLDSATASATETTDLPDVDDPNKLPVVVQVASARLPTTDGAFRIHAYREMVSGREHVALTAPGAHPQSDAVPLVRVHSECLTGDAFGSLRCDCGPQLHAALQAIAQQGGAVVYVSGHEGRGIGIAEKIAAYSLQDVGRDTVQANQDLGLPVDARDYRAAAAILRDLGLDRIRLLTNNPVKVEALHDAGIDVVAREQIVVGVGPENRAYLSTKRTEMGHIIDAARLAATTPMSDDQQENV